MSSVLLAARLCLSPAPPLSHLGFFNAAQLKTRGTGGLMVIWLCWNWSREMGGVGLGHGCHDISVQ
jgi:hypothetical protein